MILHVTGHGEAASKRHSYAGQLDVDLTDVGSAQVLAIVKQGNNYNCPIGDDVRQLLYWCWFSFSPGLLGCTQASTPIASGLP